MKNLNKNYYNEKEKNRFFYKHKRLVLSSIIGSPAAKGIQGLTTR